MYAQARILRIADGPDEVHRRSIARLELTRSRANLTASGRPSTSAGAPVGATRP
jgi:hypothetical protein